MLCGVCIQVLLAVYYFNNQTVEPQVGPRTTIFKVRDDGGAVSQTTTVIINVWRKNDRVQLNLGVGFGVQDAVTFTEILQGGIGVGIHIVSQPHRVAIVNEEEETQNQYLEMITVHLRYAVSRK